MYSLVWGHMYKKEKIRKEKLEQDAKAKLEQEELDRKNNPTDNDLLKEIRDLNNLVN